MTPKNNLYDRVHRLILSTTEFRPESDPIVNRLNQLNAGIQSVNVRPVRSMNVMSTPLSNGLGFDYNHYMHENDTEFEDKRRHSSYLCDVSEASPYRELYEDIREIESVEPQRDHMRRDEVRVDVVDLIDDSFQSDEQRIDYYLMLSLKQSLSSITTREITIGDRDLWKEVYLQMKSQYNFELFDEINCQIRFEELFCQYLNVLKTSKSLMMASRQLTCFDLFEEIDWKSVADHRHGLVSDLKHRMRTKTNETCDEITLVTDSMSDWSDWSD